MGRRLSHSDFPYIYKPLSVDPPMSQDPVHIFLLFTSHSPCLFSFLKIISFSKQFFHFHLAPCVPLNIFQVSVCSLALRDHRNQEADTAGQGCPGWRLIWICCSRQSVRFEAKQALLQLTCFACSEHTRAVWNGQRSAHGSLTGPLPPSSAPSS